MHHVKSSNLFNKILNKNEIKIYLYNRERKTEWEKKDSKS